MVNQAVMTTRSIPYPELQEWQPSPSPNFSSDKEDNTRIENDAPEMLDTEQNCIPETDEEDDRESRGLSRSGKHRLEEKPDIHESIKELKTLLHAMCAKVETNEESLKVLHVQYSRHASVPEVNITCARRVFRL